MTVAREENLLLIRPETFDNRNYIPYNKLYQRVKVV
jgi:hypothetical protein